MNKKAFTLIELLAVIVILAIIALIAVPIIINIINGTKEKSKEISKDLYLKAVEQAILKKNLKEEFNPSTCTVQKDGNLDCNGTTLTVEVEGEKPCSGTITITKGLVTGENIGYCDGTLVKDPTPFEQDSWDTIVQNVRNGNISKYKVGDTKEIKLDGFGEETFTLRIANTTTPDVCSTSGFSQTACGFVIEFADIINKQQMNSEYTNAGGWNARALRTYLNDTIYEALPQELKDVIIDTYVVSGHGLDDNDNQNFVLENEKLYLLSPHEVWENGTDEDKKIKADSAWDNTRQLDYYAQAPTTTTDNFSRAEKRLLDGSQSSWWLRSSFSDSNRYFYRVINDGSWYNCDAPASHGIAPSFRIG